MTIKIFEVAEDEWVAAETPEQAANFYRHLVSESTYTEILEEFGQPVEVTPEQMSRMKWCDHDADPPHCVTFADRLNELLTESGRFPQAFASVV